MIYLITNRYTGDRYIGKTSRTIESRWYQHVKNAEYGLDTFLYRAIRKYGKESFTIEFLSEGLDAEEIQLIAHLKPEYNMTSGGDGGCTANSPNYKASMLKRRSYKGEGNPNYGKKGALNPNFGKKHGPNIKASETKKKILMCSNGHIFRGFQEMFEFYDVRSYYSLKKIGITWSEINNEEIRTVPLV